MKILVITRNAWDDTNAIGNTLSNFFQNINEIEFAAIYFRSASPNNTLCDYYFQISETEVLRHWFSPEAIGNNFRLSEGKVTSVTQNDGDTEKKVIRIIQKYGLKLAYSLSNYLWKSERWINKKLDDFVESFNPDIMVTFVKSAPQYFLTVQHLREKYHIPLFSWIADDEYTGLLENNSEQEIHQLKYILDESAMVRGCSEELCAYYNSIFSCKAMPLYKSCNLAAPLKTSTNSPIVIVYAGNLLYGRLDVINYVADTVETLSQIGFAVIFEIYSNTTLLPQEEQALFRKKHSVNYMGKKEYDFVKERLAAADIVLHAESFDREQIIKTKFSFSTKITDYLQSGNVIMAIGPQEIASMKYLSRIPGVCTVNCLEDVPLKLKDLLNNPASFLYSAIQTRKFAQHNHNASIIADQLRKEMENVVSGGI